MPRGHSLCIYVRFSGKKKNSLCIFRVKRQSLFHPNTEQRFFFPLKSFFIGKASISDRAHASWASHNTP